MIKVGLTGGIGSGKSTVAKAFEVLGVPVYSSDTRAKILTVTDPDIIGALKNLLGNDIYAPNGQLNKKLMADIIFNDHDKLQAVNNIIHPAVGRDFENWVEKQSGKSPYVVNEAAIMIENGTYSRYDHIVLVCAPEEMRIARAMRRDNTTRQKIEERMSKQMPDTEKMKFAHTIINNDNTQFIIPQIIELHNKLSRNR